MKSKNKFIKRNKIRNLKNKLKKRKQEKQMENIKAQTF